MVEVVLTLLREGPRRTQELADMLYTDPEVLSHGELVPFLVRSGLVVRHPRTASLALSHEYNPKWSVPLNLLAALHRQEDSNYLFRWIWETMLEQSEWANRELERDSLWPVLNTLKPPNLPLPALNSNRMSSWLRLASYTGLVQPERSNSIFLVPGVSLVRQLLEHAWPDSTEQECSLLAWVQKIERQFCRITSAPATLHPGWAGLLLLLSDLGEIKLAHYADGEGVRLGERLVTHLTRREMAA